MSYKLRYSPEVKSKDLPKIDNQSKILIKKAIEERLATRPEVFGRPLRQTLKGYWKLRIGDFRVVFKIKGKTVRIYAIIHRKNVYKKILKRI